MADLFASTLGYNLNKGKVSTLVLEAGICHRLTPEYGDQMFSGLIHLLKETGILDSGVELPGLVKHPQEIRGNQVLSVTAEHPGLYVPTIHVGDFVGEGRMLGQVIDPVAGRVLEQVKAQAAGLVFTLREHPITYSGSLLVRIALEKEPPP